MTSSIFLRLRLTPLPINKSFFDGLLLCTYSRTHLSALLGIKRCNINRVEKLKSACSTLQDTGVC